MYILLGMVFLAHVLPSLTIKLYAVDKWLFVMFTGVSVVVYTKKITQSIIQSPLKYLALLASWSFVVNGYYAWAFTDSTYISKSVFLVVFTVFSASIYVLAKKNTQYTLIAILTGGLLGLIITVSALYLKVEPVWQMPKGLFNNQNQMGRFGLSLSVLVFLVLENNKWQWNRWIVPTIFGASMFISIVPVSFSTP